MAPTSTPPTKTPLKAPSGIVVERNNHAVVVIAPAAILVQVFVVMLAITVGVVMVVVLLQYDNAIFKVVALVS